MHPRHVGCLCSTPLCFFSGVLRTFHKLWARMLSQGQAVPPQQEAGDQDTVALTPFSLALVYLSAFPTIDTAPLPSPVFGSRQFQHHWTLWLPFQVPRKECRSRLKILPLVAFLGLGKEHFGKSFVSLLCHTKAEVGGYIPIRRLELGGKLTPFSCGSSTPSLQSASLRLTGQGLGELVAFLPRQLWLDSQVAVAVYFLPLSFSTWGESTVSFSFIDARPQLIHDWMYKSQKDWEWRTERKRGGLLELIWFPSLNCRKPLEVGLFLVFLPPSLAFSWLITPEEGEG